MNDPSPPGPETESPRPQPRNRGQIQKRGPETNNEAARVNEKLKLAIEKLSEIEKYLEQLVSEDVVKFHMLILATSRCRRAKEAIAAHLTDAQPRTVEQWWDR